MTLSIKKWFQALSQREKILVSMAGVLLALTILVYAIILPFLSALEQAADRYEESITRQIVIEHKVALINAPLTDGQSLVRGAPDIVVGQSAGEAGFAVSRIDPQTGGRVNIVISSAKSTALFSWLAGLESRAIVTESLSIQPSDGGTIGATITLRAKTGK